MKITCIDDARSYERVLYALRSLPQGKAVRSYVDDIKRDLRAFYHRPDGCPPWNDRYDDGCREFTGCESCWFGYINSEAE